MPRTKGVKNVNPAHMWTNEEIEFLRVNYPEYDCNELLRKFNEQFKEQITKCSLKAALGRYNIKSGRTGHWQKGHTPYTKGKTWDEYMSKEGQANSRKTWFNKERTVNNAIHNEVPVGTEYVFRDYIVVKTDKPDGNLARRWWKFKHHIVWEEAYGPIPKDHVVIFADGNKRNFELDNLILIKRSELAILNKNGLIYKGNADATKCGVSLVKLMIRRKQRAKK